MFIFTVELFRETGAALFFYCTLSVRGNTVWQSGMVFKNPFLGEWKGSELAGMKYEQLIPWVNPGEGAFQLR